MSIQNVARWTGHEIRLQMKNGMYIAYLLVNLLYIFALGYVNGEWKGTVATLLVLTDPTFLGMIFVGGILLLEKNSRIPNGIGISPLGSGGYIIAKCLSLLVITVITAICIMMAGTVRITILKLVAITIVAAIFTMYGIVLATYAKGLNHFIALFMVGTVIGVLPVVLYLVNPLSKLLCFLPTYPLIRILSNDGWAIGEVHVLSSEGVVVSLVILLLWLIGTYYYTKRTIERRLFR